MILSRACLALLATAAVAAAGCSSSDSVGSPPPGVTCSGTASGGDSGGSLTSALASAGDGSCVVLKTGVGYTGAFTVPPGVTLAAPAGGRATINGGDAAGAAVTLGERSGLVGVDVVRAGVGVAVRAANAAITDVHVTGAKTAALGVLCTTDAQTCGAGTVTVTKADLDTSELGVWIKGAHVMMSGGTSHGHTGTQLSSGIGVVALGGAKLEMDGVTIEKNQATAVLVDGAQTTASLKNTTVQDNEDRGVWAQNTLGTIDAPALRVEGSTIVRNRIVGVGGVEARGIIIIGGRVAETRAAPVVTNLASTEQVGDGFGIFGKSTDFKVDGTIVEMNARAAGLIDNASKAGIIIVGGKISAGASGYKVVVQNTDGANVTLAAEDKSTAPALGVSSPNISLPPVL